jgi:hypothetical protein
MYCVGVTFPKVWRCLGLSRKAGAYAVEAVVGEVRAGGDIVSALLGVMHGHVWGPQ